MTKYRIDRRKALGLMGAASLVAVPGARVSAQTLDKVSYQTNWRAQAEHGGFYLAATNGIYKKYGIECDVRQGGPSLNIGQLLLLLHFGNMSKELTMHNIRMMSEKVLPDIKGLFADQWEDRWWIDPVTAAIPTDAGAQR